MRNFWAIFRKELSSYFISPVAYVVIILFLCLMAFFFCYFLAIYTHSYNQYQATLDWYFQMSSQNPFLAQQIPQPEPPNFNGEVTQPFYFWLSFMMLFILPMLTMRLFSEEKRSGTIELLLTYPVRDSHLVLGKFFACLAVFAVVLVLTLVFPLFVNLTTEKARLEPVDPEQLVGPPHGPRGDVPLPRADPRQLLGLRELAPRLGQRCLDRRQAALKVVEAGGGLGHGRSTPYRRSRPGL